MFTCRHSTGARPGDHRGTGLYFIHALPGDEDNRRRFKDDIDWQELEKWKDIGGVRIEDDLLITEHGN
jgi:Xaa-Pro aminopeptidase